MTVIVDLLCPVSEGGEVTLNSANPLVDPNINLNIFLPMSWILGLV